MYYVAGIIVSAALMVFLLLPIYIRFKNQKKYLPVRVLLKGLMTLIAVLFCGAGIIHIYHECGSLWNLTTDRGFHTNILVLIGMFVCMLGDMLLPVRFLHGMLAFLTGHLCYIAYFLTIAPFNPLSIAILAVLLISLTVIFVKYSCYIGKMKIPFFIYGTVIITTFSLGIFLPFSLGPYGIVPAVAAILLVISDFMLAANRVKNRKVFSDLLYLGYYFTGQFFLALSVFLPAFLNL